MAKKAKTLVGIVMGSDSDLSVMKEAAEILEQAGVSFEITIASAHRAPRRVYDYAESAAKRGLKLIIAGAGGAAHLPGVVAALTPLPVIGVPIKTGAFSGLDSLLSIVQMPSGIPVATVGVNGAKNAGLLAVRILGLEDAGIAGWIEGYRKKLESEVEKKAKKLELAGFRDYLQDT